MEKKDTDYSARITGALSLIKETKIFFKELNDDKELDEISKRVLEENIFDKTSIGRRKRIFSAIKQRFFVSPEVNSKIYEMVIYWSEEDDAYIAEVPELPGCMGDGRTYEDAIRNTLTVIREWIETASELGREIPIPKGRLIYA